ncbi:sulfotransferase [Bacteroidota bacterium]
MQTKPNFFIIGAAKAGTTSLYRYLNQHPGIYFSPVKEPNFFSTDIKPESFKSDYRKQTPILGNKYFKDKPLKDVHLSFIRNEDYYFQLFENVKKETAIGECSTSYLFSTQAAKEIYSFNPDARIISILRNPIERALSHYLMGVRFGYTSKPFRETIEEDMRAKEKGWGISKLYIELGFYWEQLQRYIDLFNKNNLRFYLTDELTNNPQQLLSDVYHFLEVEDMEIQDNGKFNEARIPKYKKLNKILYQTGLDKYLKFLLSDSFTQKIKSSYYTKEELPALNESDKLFLAEIYAEDIRKTESIIGKDLSIWLD